MKNNNDKVPTLRELFPQFSEEKLLEVDARIERRAKLIFEMHERITADPVAYAKFKESLKRMRERDAATPSNL